jgi:hypothetical protein
VSVDLGSPALEIAIALSFVFFLLSTLAATIGEWFAGVLKLRSKMLKKGLEGMLGDSDVVNDLLDHALIRTDLGATGDGEKGIWARVSRLWKAERGPSYISPRNFALAFQGVVSASSSDDSVVVKKKVAEEDKPVAPNLQQQLETLPGALADGKLPDVPALEKWFDDAMDRVSGWYKRKSQLVTFAIAVVVAIGLNASAVRIAERLSAEPSVRAAVVAKAETAAAGDEAAAAGQKPVETDGASELTTAGKNVESAYAKLDALKLPILWAGENVPWKSWGEAGLSILGWLITIVAICLGAPFWFDALKKVSNLRMAGKKPEPEPEPRK